MLIGNYQCRKNEGSCRCVCLGGCCVRSALKHWGWDDAGSGETFSCNSMARPPCVIQRQISRSQGAVLQHYRESQVSFMKLELNLWLRFMRGTLLSLEIPGTVFYHPPWSERLTLHVGYGTNMCIFTVHDPNCLCRKSELEVDGEIISFCLILHILQGTVLIKHFQ